MGFRKIINEYSSWSDIALWGPTQAGKDWLLHSFIKELENLNLRNNRYYYDLSIVPPKGVSQHRIPLQAIPPEGIGPTIDFADHHLLFSRYDRPKRDKHQNQSQKHDLVIHNDAGANLIDCLSNPEKFNNTYSALVNALNIILVLGIPDISSNIEDPKKPNEENGTKSDKKNHVWTKSHYIKFIKLLFDTISTKPNRNIAICLTKCDQEQTIKSDPWEMLSYRFGEELRDYLESRDKKINIEVFNTTSAGYVEKDGKRIPNYKKGDLLEVKDWDPINVASPFFWIFEQIEQMKYDSKSLFLKIVFGQKSDRPAPYPRPLIIK